MNYYETTTTIATTTDALVFERIQDDIIYGALIGLVLVVILLAIRSKNNKSIF